MLIGFIPNLILVFAFRRPPISVYTKFQLDWSTNTRAIAIYAKCRQRRKNEEIFSKVWLLVSQEWLTESSFNCECGLPWEEGTSAVNLVPFGSGITELWMSENCKFVVPVNILTPFVRTPFSWAATVYLDILLYCGYSCFLWLEISF